MFFLKKLIFLAEGDSKIDGFSSPSMISFFTYTTEVWGDCSAILGETMVDVTELVEVVYDGDVGADVVIAAREYRCYIFSEDEAVRRKRDHI